MFQLQLECAHLLYNDSSCVGSDIRIGTYCMYTYVEQTSANSCVDRLSTEGGRDSSSRLMQW